MGLADCARETFLPPRHDNEVNVIGHQTINPDLRAGVLNLLSHRIAIDFVVAVFKEDGLAAIAALRNVMRHARQNNSGQPRHARNPGMRAGAVFVQNM
ncbi:MAG: hypothetical protein ACREHV_17835 [Rhizomicrobium sp.]